MASPGITKNTNANGTVSYTADINLKGYPRQKKTWDTLEQAQQWRRIEITKLKDKAAGLYVAPDGTIGELVKRYIADYGRAKGGWSDSKQKNLDKIVDEIGGVRIKDFTKQSLIAYGYRLAKTRGPGGTAERLAYLAKVFKVGFDDYDMNTPREETRSGMAVLKSRGIIGPSNERDRQIEEHEIVKIKQHLGVIMQDIVDVLMILPLRVGELCAIRWEDINEIDRSVRLLRKDTNKEKTAFRKTAWVALPVIEPVKDGKVVEVDTFKLIAGRDRNAYRPFPIDGRDASRQFSLAHQLAGVEDIHLHDCRAEAISALLDQGFDPMIVSEISGHRASKPRSTRLEVMQRRAVRSYVRKASKPPKWSQPAWPRASHRHLSCRNGYTTEHLATASPLRFEMTIKLTLDRVHFDHPANWRD